VTADADGGLVVVISGPSGVGKGTVLRRVLAQIDEATFSVSVTTRPPRTGERDGVDYHFVDDAEFDRIVVEGGFLEWAEYAGRRYGTLRDTVDAGLAEGRVVLLDIEVQGAEQVRRACPDALLVFLLPPSGEELERRLGARGTETPEAARRRLEVARVELEAADRFDVTVVNDDLDACVSEVVAAIDRVRR
jgi:guanylate kinase